ncbi:MAG TPA: hypothetical protein VJA21_09290 [Verrucomicrobiae bacterium]
MSDRFYRLVRDLHLYCGLFSSPFVLVFAFSVFFLVHAWLPGGGSAPTGVRLVTDVPLPTDLDRLSGRARIDALKPALDFAGVHGEVGWVQHLAKEDRLVIPVSVPGRVTTVTIEVAKREASVEARNTGVADALVVLHKSPGPHLVGMRMNWFYMRVWYWLVDSTVYLVLFITLSGMYLWYVLRAERRIGIGLLAAGAISFFSLVYALIH